MSHLYVSARMTVHIWIFAFSKERTYCTNLEVAFADNTSLSVARVRPRRSQLQGSESSGYHALMGTNGEIILLDIFSGAEVPVRDFFILEFLNLLVICFRNRRALFRLVFKAIQDKLVRTFGMD